MVLGKTDKIFCYNNKCKFLNNKCKYLSNKCKFLNNKCKSLNNNNNKCFNSINSKDKYYSEYHEIYLIGFYVFLKILKQTLKFKLILLFFIFYINFVK